MHRLSLRPKSHPSPCRAGLAASSALLVAGGLLAQAGTLDPSFGAAGIVLGTTPGETVSGIGVQSDGKIVIGGRNLQTSAALVRRYQDDGTVDTTFGIGGDADLGPFAAFELRTIAIDPVGRVLVAGQDYPTFAVLRLTPSGVLDSSFGNGGAVLVSQAHAYEAVSVAVQPDGRIVAHGTGSRGTNPWATIVVVRLLGNGTLDTTFGSDRKKKGTTVIDFGSQVSATAIPRQLALMPDGRIVVGGYVTPPFSLAPLVSQFLVRLQTDGTVDTTFGSSGTLQIDGFPGGIAAQPDGKLLLSTSSAASGTESGMVRRLQGNGSLDPTFGSGGIATFGLTGVHEAHAVLLRSDGRILVDVVAQVDAATWSSFPVQLLTDGSIDATFGTAGFGDPVLVPGTQTDAGFGGMALNPQGRLVEGGQSGTGPYLAVLARYRT